MCTSNNQNSKERALKLDIIPNTFKFENIKKKKLILISNEQINKHWS